jgi:methyl-accepting chemotaxis protein
MSSRKGIRNLRMMPIKRIRFGLTAKLAIVGFCCLTALNIYACVFAIPAMHSRLEQERETKVQEEVQIAYGTVQQYYDLESQGLLSRADAQDYALAAIGGLSYGSDGSGHFWVTDYQPTLLANPSMAEWIGTNVGGLTDDEGRPIFLDLASMCMNQGEGFYKYKWDGSPTLAYAAAFTPWSWTIGTASSTGDVSSLSAFNKWTLGAISGGVGVLSLIVFVLVTRVLIVRPLMSMVKTSEALAVGDVDQKINIQSNDEIGALAAAYSRVIDYMKEMAGITKRIADGDLTVEIEPKSEKDVLSNAFTQMVASQRELIGKVKATALSVSEAGRQLSRASEQTAQVTQQITGTIQQVARGASDQSLSLQETNRNMEQLSKAITQIAKGAQEQANGVDETAHMVGQVSAAAGQVSGNARAGADAWKSTATSAEQGAQKTHETIEGMERIKKAMEVVSVKVEDLGDRSDEIGKIVATIDDIAAQTNLLALNAAIEAARAGEQGRGFAVVADEVRKLAERSSTATKEIAVLIGGIQGGVKDAVSAMQQGGKEVEDGYKLAADAGEALDGILERARDVGRQVEQISNAAQELDALSSDMVKVIDKINKIVEQNVAATEQMSSSSANVWRSVEATSGVAEENSAAAQEVSASAEEMSAQVEEVLASAQSLTDMSEELERSVTVFKTEGDSE